MFLLWLHSLAMFDYIFNFKFVRLKQQMGVRIVAGFESIKAFPGRFDCFLDRG